MWKLEEKKADTKKVDNLEGCSNVIEQPKKDSEKGEKIGYLTNVRQPSSSSSSSSEIGGYIGHLKSTILTPPIKVPFPGSEGYLTTIRQLAEFYSTLSNENALKTIYITYKLGFSYLLLLTRLIPLSSLPTSYILNKLGCLSIIRQPKREGEKGCLSIIRQLKSFAEIHKKNGFQTTNIKIYIITEEFQTFFDQLFAKIEGNFDENFKKRVENYKKIFLERNKNKTKVTNRKVVKEDTVVILSAREMGTISVAEAEKRYKEKLAREEI